MSPAAIITIAVARRRRLGGDRSRHRCPPRRRPRCRRAEPRDAPARQGRRDRPARGARPVGRSSAPSAKPAAPASSPAAPIDARRVGAARRRGARRQPPPVPQPGDRLVDGRRPHHVRRGRFVAFLWPTAKGGFGGKINVGKLDDVISSIQPAAASSTTPRPARGSRSTRSTRCPKAKGVANYKPLLDGMQNGIVALYQKCPHLGCRVPHASAASGSSARATARSTTASARRRAARRRAAWTASSSPCRRPATSSSTPAPCFPARPSAPTPPAKRPRARTASVAEVATDDRLGDHRNWLGHPRRHPARLGRLLLRQPQCGPTRARLRDRAGAQPQAVLRRRDAGGLAARAVQLIGVLLLVIMVIGLPLYWVLEPGRQAGAVSAKEETLRRLGQ